MTIISRFAPSPTGYLHIGHAFSALSAWAAAKQAGGRFLLRIEDIDRGRCRPEFVDAIYQDLCWLGLRWEEPARIQSEHYADYQRALDQLEEMGLLYRCYHSRKELKEALSAPHLTPMQGPDGPVITDTDLLMDDTERARREEAGEAYALRLRMGRALELIHARGEELVWQDQLHGTQRATPEIFGDVVLARKDNPTSYHLSVVVDDALQGVSLITRGEDLFQATHVHRLLQALLELPVPTYNHHRLLLDEQGKRLAKRDKAETLQALRADGVTGAELIERLGFELGDILG